MDGVTIIKECTELSNKGIIFMLLFAFVVAFIAFTFGYVLTYKKKSTKVILFCGTIILGTFIEKYFIIDKCEEPNGEYDVTVSSNVDMNVFHNKYDIIDYNNGVYTVKPKDSVPQPPLNIHKETTEEATTKIDGQIYKITPIE